MGANNPGMKVLFSSNLPFFLAHGGAQTLTESLMRELAGLSVEVEPERWWDENQTGDIIHYMNRPPILNVLLAKQKGFKVVMTELLDQTASRSRLQLFAQRMLINLTRAVLPGGLTARLSWDTYQHLDAAVYAVEHEWKTARYLFRARPELGHIIPHGLEPEALQQLARPQAEEDYLISAATIHPRKNSVLLARAAHQALTPIVFLGKPYAEDDPYFLEFKKWIDDRIVRYPGFVSTEEKYRYIRGARGFALLSQFESGCISVYEAAAAGLPLFLSDLPWAAKVYGNVPAAQFVRLAAPEAIAPRLKAFYGQAHRQLSPTFPLLTWRQVAERYLAIYQGVLSHS
jgi:glycosyltransferase involved in cell wall biosynthesis